LIYKKDDRVKPNSRAAMIFLSLNQEATQNRRHTFCIPLILPSFYVMEKNNKRLGIETKAKRVLCGAWMKAIGV
jgi:hypothetical protein